MREKDFSETYDKYAAAALQALISKMPPLDTKGEFGIEITDKQLEDVMKEVCESAHFYARWMIRTREGSAAWLEKKTAI
jgi:hypothetical protein